MALLDDVKKALRITTTALDDVISADIESAKLDLGIAGVVIPTQLDALVTRAIITYCQMTEGSANDYDRFKKAYDEQKAQLGMASGYTDYEE